jgi:phosphatidylglycerol:prolipoprotein diacylglycerol transferase
MFPILFRVGPVTVRMYGVMIAIGILAAFRYLAVYARRRNIPADFAGNLAFGAVIAGFAGGRLLYALLNVSDFAADPWALFRVWEGGLVFFGGLIAGLLFVVWYTLRARQRLLDVLDLFTPALFLALGFGRIGCFCAGCCYGMPTAGPLGVRFWHAESLAPVGVPLLPTQLFESAYAFGLFALIHVLFIANRLRFRLFALGVMVYSILRFFNEMLRGDDRGAPVLGLQPSQFIGMVLFALHAVVFFYITYRQRSGSVARKPPQRSA